MKQYKFVNLYINTLFGARSDEHQRIINVHASKGWRYVGYIPTEISGGGQIKRMDLVFEKDVEEGVEENGTV